MIKFSQGASSLAGLLVVPAVVGLGPVAVGPSSQAAFRITVRSSDANQLRLPPSGLLGADGLEDLIVLEETVLTDHDLDLFLTAARAEFDTTDYAYLYDDED